MTDHDSLLKTPLYVLGSEAMRDCLLDKAKDTHDAVDGVRLVEEWAIADTPAGVLLISATGNGLLRPTTDERPALVDVFVDSTRTCAASPSRARLTASELSEFLTGAHVAFGDFVRTSSGRQRWLPVVARSLRGECTDSAAGGDGRLTTRQRAEIAAVVTECDASIGLGDACDLVAEIDASFARHGAFAGGNRWGFLGTLIAIQVERVCGNTRTAVR